MADGDDVIPKPDEIDTLLGDPEAVFSEVIWGPMSVTCVQLRSQAAGFSAVRTMRTIAIRTVVTCWLFSVTLLAGAQSAPPPDFREVAATAETLAKVREGGFVLYMRHGLTDNRRPDRAPNVDLNDCATQRPLNEEGRKQAVIVGAAIKKARIPLGEIHVSPLCRVKETTQAAFGNTYKVNNNLMYTANLTTAQKRPIIETTRGLLAAPVLPGTNRVIVAHGPNLMDLIGYFPKEGTVVVFRPSVSGDFEYVASIYPEAWASLLR